MTCGGHLIRKITAISDEDVSYLDQYGVGHCTRKTFVKKCYRFATDADVAAQSASSVPEMVINQAAANAVLEIVLHIQNQITVWVGTLEQSAQVYESFLTPSQKEALKAAINNCSDLERSLAPCRDALTK